MWTRDRRNTERKEALLYFLCASLAGALDDAIRLSDQRRTPPEIRPGMETSEIRSRLANFREHVNDMQAHEALIITKITRARGWALELRRSEFFLRPVIDAFLVGTAACAELAQKLVPGAERFFDGEGVLPSRQRTPGRAGVRGTLAALIQEAGTAFGGGARGAKAAITDPPGKPEPSESVYMIGGQIAVEHLVDACEEFLAALGEHYDWEGQAERAAAPEAEDMLPDLPKPGSAPLGSDSDDDTPDPSEIRASVRR